MAGVTRGTRGECGRYKASPCGGMISDGNPPRVHVPVRHFTAGVGEDLPHMESVKKYLALPEIESRVCDNPSGHRGVRRSALHPGLRLVQDLNCDSLEVVELIMEVEDAFGVTLP